MCNTSLHIIVWRQTSENIFERKPLGRVSKQESDIPACFIKVYFADLLGDLLVYDPVAMAWTDLSAAASGTAPSPRCFHGFTAAQGRLYVHGGWDANGNPLRDLHAYDPVAMAWTNLSAPGNGTAPTARGNHGFTSVDGKLYVHGGWDGQNELGDLYSFDLVAKVWTNMTDGVLGSPPQARDSHGFTSAGGEIYVHGGQGFGPNSSWIVFDDLYKFDPTSMAWTNLSSHVSGIPPSPRYGHGFKAAGGRLFVHGGWGEFGDVFVRCRGVEVDESESGETWRTGS